MFAIDESFEDGAIIRAIGVGTFGLNVITNMIGRIHKVDCFGAVHKVTSRSLSDFADVMVRRRYYAFRDWSLE